MTPYQQALADLNRAKPAPVETRVMCTRRCFARMQEYGTCIKRNGTIDWTTWEPQS